MHDSREGESLTWIESDLESCLDTVLNEIKQLIDDDETLVTEDEIIDELKSVTSADNITISLRLHILKMIDQVSIS